MKFEELIYDWNATSPQVAAFGKPVFGKVDVDDETLRDGLQSPSIREPSLDEKIAILEAMVAVGIRRGDLGLPMSAQIDDIRGLLRHIVEARLPFRPGLAVRTVESDIAHVADLQQEFGIPVTAEAFLGCSRIRRFVEGWDDAFVRERCQRAVRFAREHGVRIMFVTEDTTRAHPDDIREIYGLAIAEGADEVCIADTVGHAMPWGAAAVVEAVRAVVSESGRDDVLVHWHGHSDRGMAIVNALAAASAGADVLHATGLGIGERAGNTPMDLLLVNLQLLGVWGHDLHELSRYVDLISRAVGIEVPVNYPVFGRDAFRTATGVHAAAIAKAAARGDTMLADLVYSGVPATPFGRSQQIEVGRMSGRSNVLFWLARNNLPPDDELVTRILERAHSSRTVLTDEELRAIVREWQG